jgi:hypothetical protein
MALININNCTDHATRNNKWNDEQYVFIRACVVYVQKLLYKIIYFMLNSFKKANIDVAVIATGMHF